MAKLIKILDLPFLQTFGLKAKNVSIGKKASNRYENIGKIIKMTPCCCALETQILNLMTDYAAPVSLSGRSRVHI